MIWPSSRILTPSSGYDIKYLSEDACAESKSQAARDNVALNLRRPAADHGQARVAEKPLHRIFHAVAVAAEDLQSEVRYRLVGFAGVELQHRRVAARGLALRYQPGEPVDQRA